MKRWGYSDRQNDASHAYPTGISRGVKCDVPSSCKSQKQYNMESTSTRRVPFARESSCMQRWIEKTGPFWLVVLLQRYLYQQWLIPLSPSYRKLCDFANVIINTQWLRTQTSPVLHVQLYSVHWPAYHGGLQMVFAQPQTNVWMSFSSFNPYLSPLHMTATFCLCNFLHVTRENVCQYITTEPYQQQPGKCTINWALLSDRQGQRGVRYIRSACYFLILPHMKDEVFIKNKLIGWIFSQSYHGFRFLQYSKQCLG